MSEIHTKFTAGLATLGFAGMAALFIRSYSMGAGTYTGIEAVSNGIQIMREPRVETAKRTMLYMALSLALTASGILVLYLLFRVTPEAGKTMNAVLLERFAGNWTLAGVPAGKLYVILTLGAEAALLFVAAQTGFIDGPRVMANMSVDSWLPHRFRSLSDRLTMHQGVILISGAALITLIATGGSASALVLMYSINVFLTFSLSQLGMVRYWMKMRTRFTAWKRPIIIHLIGLALCLTILTISLYEKFGEGGWVTILVTVALITLCFIIHRHYRNVLVHLKRLDSILQDLPAAPAVPVPALNPQAPTAALLVSSYSGLGIHSFFTVLRLFPGYFKNIVFLSIAIIDAGNLKGKEDVAETEEQTRRALKRYVELANQYGIPATYRLSMGTEVLGEAKRLSLEIAHEFPRTIFFPGRLIFQKERWYQKLLHNETAQQFQRGIQFAGLNSMVLPIRVFEDMQPA